MKRRNNNDDILLPTGFMHRALERDRERERAEEAEGDIAEIERVLAACPDTFIFYSKGANEILMVHIPFGVRMRHFDLLDVYDESETVRRALAESILIHIRLFGD